MGRRVLLALLSAAVLVGLVAQPGAAVNVPQAVVVSSNPVDWTPHVLDGKVESLAVAPDGLHVFAGGSFTKINGVAQKRLVKLRLSDGARITAFKGKTNARVKDMAVSGGRLYIGGTFKTANGVARSALAALDPVNGLPLSWNPGRDRGVGAFALVATSQGLWIGSDTDRTGRYEYHGRIAFMPLAGGTPVPESGVGTLPGDLLRLATDGTMTRRAFDGTTAGFTTPIALNGLTSTQFPISRVTGMLFWNGRLYYTLSGDPRLYYRWFTPESGTTAVLSGPAIDGQTWQSRGLLVLNLPT